MFTGKRLLIAVVGALAVAVSTATVVNANASTGPAARSMPAAPPAGAQAAGGRIALTGNGGADLAGTCYLDVPPAVGIKPSTPGGITPGYTEVVSSVSVSCDPDVPVASISVDGSLLYDDGLGLQEKPSVMASLTNHVQLSYASVSLQAACELGFWTVVGSAVVTLTDNSTRSSGPMASQWKFLC